MAERGFRETTVHALFEGGRADKDRLIKLGEGALKLKTELMNIFVEETLMRLGQIAHHEGFSEVHPEHVEKILPQLLLDFS